MTRLLYFTDVHVKPINPRSRKDEYYETIKNKLRWIGELGEELEVDAFVCGGDLFDRPDASYSTVIDLVDIFADFKAPIYSVLGNHDIHGYNPDTCARTAMGVLVSTGLVKRLSKDPVIFNDISLTGTDSYHGLDRPGSLADYTDIKRTPGTKSVHVVHGFLASKPWPKEVPHTLISDVEDTNADVILAGHEHSGFYEERNGRIFCNPGSLGRVTAGLGDINLEVKVAVVESDGSSIHLNLVKLPEILARPASEVLDREKLELENRRTEVIANVAAETRKFREGITIESANPWDLVANIKDQGVVDENVANYMLEVLEQVTLEDSER